MFFVHIPGTAVFPGGSARGGERGVPDEIDGLGGGWGGDYGTTITLLQQGTHARRSYVLLMMMLRLNILMCCLCVFQVLRLLEDVGLPDLVIQLATLAVSEAVNDRRSQVHQRSILYVL